ncbi:MAG TPA: hypothetical protein VKB53_06925 [Gammaproteobacteria bacterium]|nr:hypothetical protein [Gammaproteobacteria bacterium]
MSRLAGVGECNGGREAKAQLSTIGERFKGHKPKASRQPEKPQFTKSGGHDARVSGG